MRHAWLPTIALLGTLVPLLPANVGGADTPPIPGPQDLALTGSDGFDDGADFVLPSAGPRLVGEEAPLAPPERSPARADVIVERFHVPAGGHLRVTAGPGTAIPGETLVDVRLPPRAEARWVVVGVMATDSGRELPVFLVERE